MSLLIPYPVQADCPAFVILVFGGMIAMMLLGIAIDQIPDPKFAGTIPLNEVDPRDEEEKGSRAGRSDSVSGSSMSGSGRGGSSRGGRK